MVQHERLFVDLSDEYMAGTRKECSTEFYIVIYREGRFLLNLSFFVLKTRNTIQNFISKYGILCGVIRQVPKVKSICNQLTAPNSAL